jgi:hypothetical protein
MLPGTGVPFDIGASATQRGQVAGLHPLFPALQYKTMGACLLLILRASRYIPLSIPIVAASESYPHIVGEEVNMEMPPYGRAPMCSANNMRPGSFRDNGQRLPIIPCHDDNLTSERLVGQNKYVPQGAVVKPCIHDQ